MNPNETENPVPTMEVPAFTPDASAASRSRLRLFMICVAVITAAFAFPLWQTVKHALDTPLQSHILLIPFVSWYLIGIAKAPRLSHGKGIKGEGQGEVSAPRSSIIPGGIAAFCGLVALAAYWHWGVQGKIPHNDALSLAMTGFLAFQLASALFTLGWPILRSRFFAVAFLVFMIPLPLALTEFMSIALQRVSADAADWMLGLVQMPFLRDGLHFQMPGLAILVAEECSGVRSTFVLFITSLLAGHLFLRTGWKKAVLALAIFPLGILRNGFRITTISWLTVNVDAGIIDGPLHHQGGPLFFALSLVPLFGLLWVLRRSDSPRSRKRLGGTNSTSPSLNRQDG